MKLFLRKLVGLITSPFYPEYSWCGRCWRKWSVCDAHTTYFEHDEDGTPLTGCFPLCEECWGDLTAQERAPYYEVLFQAWLSNARDWVRRDELARIYPLIMEAVRRGD